MDILIENKISKFLVQNELTIATAESCTGGLIGHRITNIDGSSRYYLGSVIAYANEIKQNILGVSPETLEVHGAVSADCVAEMAKGVCKSLNVDIGLSVSGIAGPTGGAVEKPVGLVYIGLNTPDGVWTSKQYFDGDRISVKEKAAEFGLKYLLSYLEGNFNN